MSLTLDDLTLLQAIASGSVTRHDDGRWTQHHTRMPASAVARLDEFLDRRLVVLTDTGAGFAMAGLTGKGANARGELCGLLSVAVLP